MNNAADIWTGVLRYMQNELNLTTTTIDTWFYDMTAAKFENNLLTLVTTADFKKDIIIKNYTDRINTALEAIFSAPVRFELYTQEEFDGPAIANSTPISNYEEYSFDTFVVGSANKFAHAAAKAVATQPGRSVSEAMESYRHIMESLVEKWILPNYATVHGLN